MVCFASSRFCVCVCGQCSRSWSAFEQGSGCGPWTGTTWWTATPSTSTNWASPKRCGRWMLPCTSGIRGRLSSSRAKSTGGAFCPPVVSVISGFLIECENGVNLLFYFPHAALMSWLAPWMSATRDPSRTISQGWTMKSMLQFIITVLLHRPPSCLFICFSELWWLIVREETFHLLTSISCFRFLQAICISSMRNCSTSTITTPGRWFALWGPTPFWTADGTLFLYSIAWHWNVKRCTTCCRKSTFKKYIFLVLDTSKSTQNAGIFLGRQFYSFCYIYLEFLYLF